MKKKVILILIISVLIVLSSLIGLNYLKKITNKKVKIKKEIINDVFIVSLILPLKK